MNEQLEFLTTIASRLTHAGFDYMVTGSIAMALYGIPRMTRDIDVVIECEPEDAGRLAALFERDCYVDAGSIREAAIRRDMFNIIHHETVIKADFIVRKDEDYRKLEFERRHGMEVEGTAISVVSPEDLILSKLWWAKDSDSELQQRDVRQLLHALPEIDRAYLRTWAAKLGVADPLAGAESE